MKEEEIEGNKLIAEFMGSVYDGVYYRFPNTERWTIGNMEYHSSWDWLMPVIDYIDTISERNNGLVYCQTNATSHTFYINYNDGRVINNNFPKYNHGRHRAEGESRIYNVFLSVVEFIKWYNKQK